MLSTASYFKALGDPIRIEVLHRLIQGKNSTLNEISSGLGISRQGVRKHLTVLENAGVIELRKNGRAIEAQFKPNSLIVMKKFIEKLELQWDKRLLALKKFVENTP